MGLMLYGVAFFWKKLLYLQFVYELHDSYLHHRAQILRPVILMCSLVIRLLSVCSNYHHYEYREKFSELN